MSTKRNFAGVFLLLSCLSLAAAVTPDLTIQLWPEEPPGITRATGPEIKLQNRPRPFYQLTQIAEPRLEIFIPKEIQANGTAILVCPGGGMQRLAYEHEGLEVAQWLNANGILAGVLKYRVPGPAKSGAIDAQRALSLMRQRASDWSMDVSSVGILGFSAGGEIGTWLLTHPTTRLYDPVDDSDQISIRPSFAGLIYSGGLLDYRTKQLKPEFADNIKAGLPPVFLAHAFNDGCQNSLSLALALKQAGVPTELHLYQDGGHGFGARSTGVPVSSWKSRFIEWLDTNGHMDPSGGRQYIRALSKAIENKQSIPSLQRFLPNADLMDAYRIQNHLVRERIGKDGIGGFKGAAASVAAQQSLGIDGPLVGILPATGKIPFNKDLTFKLSQTGPMAIETEVGYRIAVDISYEVLTDEQARDAVSAIVPVIELPTQHPPGTEGSPALNMAASNIGSFQYIIGEDLDPTSVDPDAWTLKLSRDKKSMHEIKGRSAHGGQYHNLRKIMNQLTRNGHTLPAGTLIISGALGGVHPAVPGHYRAAFGTETVIDFRIED